MFVFLPQLCCSEYENIGSTCKVVKTQSFGFLQFLYAMRRLHRNSQEQSRIERSCGQVFGPLIVHLRSN